MKTLLLSILLGFITETYFAVSGFVGEAHAQTQLGRFMKFHGEVVHAPAVFLYHSVFGPPSSTSVPWVALSFVFVVQWALYSGIVFGIFRLVRYAQRHAA